MLVFICMSSSSSFVQEKESKKSKTTASQTTTTLLSAFSSSAPQNPTATATATVASPGTSTSLLSESVPESGVLRDLMDMGFPRQRCVEALNVTSTVESATEYLLTHMTAGSSAGGGPGTNDDGMSEDEQIMAAIQLSLSSISDDASAAAPTSSVSA